VLRGLARCGSSGPAAQSRRRLGAEQEVWPRRRALGRLRASQAASTSARSGPGACSREAAPEQVCTAGDVEAARAARACPVSRSGVNRRQIGDMSRCGVWAWK
jgi:hypothetical protein